MWKIKNNEENIESKQEENRETVHNQEEVKEIEKETAHNMTFLSPLYDDLKVIGKDTFRFEVKQTTMVYDSPEDLKYIYLLGYIKEDDKWKLGGVKNKD